MAVTITSKDRGAEALLKRLLSKGALSVGVLAADAARPHKGAIKATEKKERKWLNAHSRRGGFLTRAQQDRRSTLNKKAKDLELTIGEIAAIHEFGLGSVPQRSFLAGWADENPDKIKNAILKGAQALVRGSIKDPIQFLNAFGAWAVGQVQRRMAQNIPPPLAPATIKRKGSSVALIDTGQLRSSISFRVDAVQLGKGSTFITKIGAGQ